jgi:hypothetical protein
VRASVKIEGDLSMLDARDPRSHLPMDFGCYGKGIDVTSRLHYEV